MTINLFTVAAVLFLIDYDGAKLVCGVLKHCCQPCHRAEEEEGLKLILLPCQAASSRAASMAKLSIGCVHTPRQFGMQKGSKYISHTNNVTKPRYKRGAHEVIQYISL